MKSKRTIHPRDEKIIMDDLENVFRIIEGLNNTPEGKVLIPYWKGKAIGIYESLSILKIPISEDIEKFYQKIKYEQR